METKYKLYNGISYHESTPMEVVKVLDAARLNKQRIRIHLGTTESSISKKPIGTDWMEEYDVEGTVGNSTGSIKVPLLIANSRSSGGGAILDNCIVKITTTGKNKRTLYQHPNYNRPKLTIKPVENADWIKKGYTHCVCYDGEFAANFKTLRAAKMFLDKMS